MIKTNKQTNKALTEVVKQRKREYACIQRNRTYNQSRARNFFNPQPQPLAITAEAPVENNITTLALTDIVEAPVENNTTTLVVYDPDIEADQIDDQNEINRDWLAQHVNRLLISRYYSEALSSPPPCEWNGRGGTFGRINSVFPSLSLKLI